MFGIGPAGTGKTYLAVAKAVQALQSKEVNRIILTRPAVEAGSASASCPARSAKIDPTCDRSTTPCTTCSTGSHPRLMTSGTIEVAPLATCAGAL